MQNFILVESLCVSLFHQAPDVVCYLDDAHVFFNVFRSLI